MRFALAAAGLGLAVLFAGCDGGSDGQIGEVRSFYIEAEFTVWENAEGLGTNLVTPGPELENRGTIRWWSQSVTEFRQEFEIDTSHDGGREAMLILGSGTTMTFYRSDENTYQTQPLVGIPDGLVAWPIPGSFVLGPPRAEGGRSGFDGATDQMEAVNDRPRPIAELQADRVAGRYTRVFEGGPVGCSLTVLGSSNITPVPECTGTFVAWIDAETGFFLRFEAEDPGVQRIEVVVTRIDYNPEFEDELFTFVPPAGAVEED